MIRRSVVVLLSLIFGLGVLSAQTQEQIVYIDGTKFQVYSVVAGDTLYSLSKRFGVTIDQIVQVNPVLTEGLKAGQTLKIPQPQEPKAKNQKADKRSKRQFRSYIVRKGDTLYSISRLYEISVQTLIADNDNIDPAHLSVGQTIYIRRSEIGQTTEAESKKELEEHSQAVSSITVVEDYRYHLVHSGETAENIASRFGADVESLLKLNGFKSATAIREGLIIKVPTSPTQTPAAPQTEPEQTTSTEPAVALSTTGIDSSIRAQVALMLPLGKNGVASQNYIDFYQGFLLGADHLRMAGLQSHINLYNTAHDLDKVSQIIDSAALEQCNLIVGPVYEDTLIPVARYAEKRGIAVVSPLPNLTQTSAENLFQMSPRPQTKFDKVGELFDGSRRVVFITSQTTDSAFETEVKQVMGNIPYTTHKYEYEHPSVIEKREKARAEGVEVPPSSSDLSPLLDSKESTVFVVLAGTEVEVDRILAALASANISLSARSVPTAPYVVFGNNKWNRYKNLDHSLFFTNNMVMLSTYHIDRSDKAVRNFGAQYIKAFGALPTLYAYRGYDAAVIFIKNLYSNLGTLEGECVTPLQTPYRFVLDPQSRVRVNDEWVRVNYHNNFTITAQ